MGSPGSVEGPVVEGVPEVARGGESWQGQLGDKIRMA